MFLIGGPAFSGTTLLTHLLNQGKLLCLDEPDFHNIEQSHRGIPFLQQLFPNKLFPNHPEKDLNPSETIELIHECETALNPYDLGFKTCNKVFTDYAKQYRELGYPIIGIIRDIRDTLVRPLPSWIDEKRLNKLYRHVWNNLDLCDLWVRYEELILEPEVTMKRISQVLQHNLAVKNNWDVKSVHHHMFKLDRHELLRTGKISNSRIDIWKNSGKIFSNETYDTAAMMGY